MLAKTVVYFLLDRALTLIKIEHAANFVGKKIKTVVVHYTSPVITVETHAHNSTMGLMLCVTS